jgi:hypothetical protein
MQSFIICALHQIKKCEIWGGGAHSSKVEMRSDYKIMLENSERSKPLGRCKRRWKYNIKLILRNWIHLAQDRVQCRQIKNACYHSVQNLLSYRLLSKIFKFNIYKTVILPSLLYGYET